MESSMLGELDACAMIDHLNNESYGVRHLNRDVYCRDATWNMSLITDNLTNCSTFYSDLHWRKHQSSASLDVCDGNPPLTGGFPSQRASDAENISMAWRDHGLEALISYGEDTPVSGNMIVNDSPEFITYTHMSIVAIIFNIDHYRNMFDRSIVSKLFSVYHYALFVCWQCTCQSKFR